MEEEKTRLYGECAYVTNRLIDKFTEDDKLSDKWDGFIDRLTSIDDCHFETERDLYLYYKFLVQIFWRTRTWQEGQPFNRVSKKEVYAKDSKVVPGYTIWNYDYKMFLWAVKNNHTYGLSPSAIDVTEEELAPAELKRFEKKVEKTNE